MRNSAIACLAAMLAALALGCGGGSGSAGGDSTATAATESTASRPRPPEPKPAPKPRPEETVTASHCPEGHPACRTTEGRILYVERVDPDGDGDAHFVILDPQGITLPGLTSIDVRVGLRPEPLPGPGDLVSAAGPVQVGSFGQDQIHALELHVAGQ